MKKFIVLGVLLLLINTQAQTTQNTYAAIRGEFTISSWKERSDLIKSVWANGHIAASVPSDLGQVYKLFNVSKIFPEYVGEIAPQGLGNATVFPYQAVIDGNGEDIMYLISKNQTNHLFLTVIKYDQKPEFMGELYLNSEDAQLQLIYFNKSVYIVEGDDQFAPGKIIRVDVSDPKNPTYITEAPLTNNGAGIVKIIGIKDNKLIISNQGDRLNRIEVLNPENLSRYSYYASEDYFVEGQLFGDYIIADPFYILNATDLTNIQPVTGISKVDYTYIQGTVGDLAFYLNGTALSFFDADLQEVANIDMVVDELPYSSFATYNTTSDSYFLYINYYRRTQVIEVAHHEMNPWGFDVTTIHPGTSSTQSTTTSTTSTTTNTPQTLDENSTVTVTPIATLTVGTALIVTAGQRSKKGKQRSRNLHHK